MIRNRKTGCVTHKCPEVSQFQYINLWAKLTFFIVPLLVCVLVWQNALSSDCLQSVLELGVGQTTQRRNLEKGSVAITSVCVPERSPRHRQRSLRPSDKTRSRWSNRQSRPPPRPPPAPEDLDTACWCLLFCCVAEFQIEHPRCWGVKFLTCTDTCTVGFLH